MVVYISRERNYQRNVTRRATGNESVSKTVQLVTRLFKILLFPMLLYDVLYESFSERGYSMVEKEERNIPCARDATRYERSREVSPDRDSRTTYPSKKV